MYKPGASRCEAAAEALRSSGYDVKPLKGGFPAWEQAGHVVQSEA